MDLLIGHFVAAHGIPARPFAWPAAGDITAIDALLFSWFSCLGEEGADRQRPLRPGVHVALMQCPAALRM